MQYTGTISGAAIGLVGATIGLTIAFGVPIDKQLQDALLAEAAAIANVAPLIGAIIDHSRAQVESRAANSAAAVFKA